MYYTYNYLLQYIPALVGVANLFLTDHESISDKFQQLTEISLNKMHWNESVNKLELITALGMQENLSHTESKRIVDIFFDAMSDAMIGGGRVEIRGLCAFKVKAYAGYKGRNPKTGKTVRVKTKKLPVFKAGTELKQRVKS